ncbi:AraC family transcriptional regulator [Natronospirillum operosum]|uniref:AraC family transcriptional regulator n=1 Tax=Natronospirillum operosum TaxID=2759953 RepID=A0A4Z0W3K0_9GAMM|nr:helix-turn-helix domain-containing protein [Natronospirillum operosum]TGG91698.1 AraC family transcriptional regulator [Natronospirillum operosum]
MDHGYHRPGSGTAAYLSTLLTWHYRSSGEPGWPVLPAGVSAFVCLGEAGGSCRFWLQSQTLSPRDFELHGNECLLAAVFFRPFMAAPVFGVPVDRLMQGPVSLSEVDSDAADQLTAALSALAAKPDAAAAGLCELVEGYLLRRIHRNRELCEIIRQAVDMILTHPEQDTLREIKDLCAVSDRRLQRLFNTYVGLSPNRFRRLCQFQQSFQQLQHGGAEDLTDLALQAGYADQSHFNRSFREFTGHSPGGYLKNGLRGLPKNRKRENNSNPRDK